MTSWSVKHFSHRRTKIICTIGPASMEVETLEKMIMAGMNVARLNFSHGDYAYHEKLIYNIFRAAERTGKSIAILQDLCGPKIRMGVMPNGFVDLVDGQEVFLHPGAWQESWGPDELPVEYEGLLRDLKNGDRMLFDDGSLEAVVVEMLTDKVKVKFVRGGKLKNKKGLNLPGVTVSMPSVTQKDLNDLEWGIEHGVDLVALSFVRSPEDLIPVQQRLAKVAEPPLLVAKIEKPEALDHIEEIVKAVDAIMVARGDLGVEYDYQKVPLIQKRLIKLANKFDKPVITATQMLESMTTNARATRAEVSDVSNAIMDGTDAVMLSGETAAGKYPVEAVTTMATIAQETEEYLIKTYGKFPGEFEDAASCIHDGLAKGAEKIARSMKVSAIVVQTLTGKTAHYLASCRPKVPVLAMSSNPRALRRMAFYWGITPAVCPPFSKMDMALNWAEDAAKDYGIAGPGDPIVIAVGRQNDSAFSGRIHIHQVGGKSLTDMLKK